MQQIINFLNKNDIGQIATVKEGKPVIRPIQFQFEIQGKFYFLTTNNKDFYDQLKEMNEVSYVAQNPDSHWVRINGEVVFDNDRDLIEKIFENRPYIKELFKTTDNPVLELFYVHNGTARLTAMEDVISDVQI
ncbi:pyridoxamine 5'-phosphate oxidase family protein [Vallitalea okinawensis]|uniref:pyridoxamine 5'-phosphate oxidase family protein n=1 Tax=Vallitalea okinawensis TaxID=2078660 RepID=UPI000CFB2B34|nr:pyridoxamine 5'-phosphate oxidase family protein [Vallitalea okinawensis]